MSRIKLVIGICLIISFVACQDFPIYSLSGASPGFGSGILIWVDNSNTDAPFVKFAQTSIDGVPTYAAIVGTMYYSWTLNGTTEVCGTKLELSKDEFTMLQNVLNAKETGVPSGSLQVGSTYVLLRTSMFNNNNADFVHVGYDDNGAPRLYIIYFSERWVATFNGAWNPFLDGLPYNVKHIPQGCLNSK